MLWGVRNTLDSPPALRSPGLALLRRGEADPERLQVVHLQEMKEAAVDNIAHNCTQQPSSRAAGSAGPAPPWRWRPRRPPRRCPHLRTPSLPHL